MTSTQEPVCRRSFFTDAEAGAKEFPTRCPQVQLLHSAEAQAVAHTRTSVEVQPDPRHYLAQGWLYGFADGKGGYPLEWTTLKAWGSDRPSPSADPGRAGRATRGRRWLARVPRPQRGVGTHALPLQRQRRPAAEPEHRGGPTGQAFEQ